MNIRRKKDPAKCYWIVTDSFGKKFYFRMPTPVTYIQYSENKVVKLFGYEEDFYIHPDEDEVVYHNSMDYASFNDDAIFIHHIESW